MGIRLPRLGELHGIGEVSCDAGCQGRAGSLRAGGTWAFELGLPVGCGDAAGRARTVRPVASDPAVSRLADTPTGAGPRVLAVIRRATADVHERAWQRISYRISTPPGIGAAATGGTSPLPTPAKPHYADLGEILNAHADNLAMTIDRQAQRAEPHPGPHISRRLDRATAIRCRADCEEPIAAKLSSSRLPTSYTFGGMADEIFEHPRLAAVYDQLDPDRSDLDAYLRLAQQLDARRVLDIGCGTGAFALLLADHGIKVVGVDPAQASIKVARSKPGSGRVRWICGDATALPPLQVDLVTMTANVAQEIVAPHTWQRTLQGAYEALRPGGHLVFETRDPAKRAWDTWNRAASHKVTDIPGVDTVESWVELVEVSGPLVTFRWNYVFAADGQQLTSDSTLRFRERQEIEADLLAQGYELQEVRDAPDRPGKEFVFVAQRP